MSNEVIFQPLEFRNLTVKNRIFRSSLAGRFNNYDGTGTRTHVNWDLKFARGGVGAIISSNAPVHPRGIIVPNYAHIDRDETIPFWRELVARVHEHDCRYLIQLAFSGRQRDIGGIVYEKGWSSTDKPEPIHGLQCERMTKADIAEVVECFAQAARRAREAGADGIEIHGCNGYLITQFLSSAINDRDDEYGGSLENRARFLLETVRSIRAEVGPDFHLQVKISATEYANAFLPWLGKGNTIADSVQVARWVEDAGADAIHVSCGSTFPHPLNPAGSMPLKEAIDGYDTLISSGTRTLRNYVLYRTWPINRIMVRRWAQPLDTIEGFNLPDARRIKEAVSIPVIVTGGFQTASVIRRALEAGDCDAVSMARPLVANNDLPRLFEQGLDRAPKPCSYCNKCLFHTLEDPLGCYDERRFESREEMIREVLSVYDPAPYSSGPVPAAAKAAQ
jgi:2,4-dienoyl-CoA reductase-like NADH-dependent reductase (Old Yellow Enzyme family)